MQRYSQGPTELLGLGVLSRAVRSLLSSREKRVFLCAARSRQHWQAGLSPVLVGGCTMSKQTDKSASISADSGNSFCGCPDRRTRSFWGDVIEGTTAKCINVELN